MNLPQNHTAAQAEQTSQHRCSALDTTYIVSMSVRCFSFPFQLIPNKQGCSCLFPGQTRAEALLCCGHRNTDLGWPRPIMVWKMESGKASKVFIRGNKYSTCA